LKKDGTKEVIAMLWQMEYRYKMLRNVKEDEQEKKPMKIIR
jgi:hypothetical protein